MPARRLYAEEIALAMEMRADGVPWSLIGPALGVSEDHMQKSVRRARQHGFRSFPPRRR